MKLNWRCLVVACLVTVCPPLAQAENGEVGNGWQHSVNIYLWGAGVSSNTSSGSGVDVSFSDLLDNLEFGAMGAYRARKGDWSVMADIIYLDVSSDKKIELGGDLIKATAEVDIDLASWVVHAGGAYNFYDNDGGTQAGVTFGLRYLDMSTYILVAFETRIPELEPRIPINASEGVLDMFAGLHGTVALGERWYIPWAANLGTGDSKLSWAALAGVGYRASPRWNVLLTYRHQAWEFDDTLIIDDLEFSGPMLGATFNF